MTRNRLLASACVCVCMLFHGTVCAAAPAYVDGVVAIVGREPILHSEIMQEIMPMVQTLRTTVVAEEEFTRQFEELFRTTLEQAIEHAILYQEAQTMGVEVPEDEIERRVTQVRKEYESAEAFQKALEEAGHTVSDFRARMRRQMMAIMVSMNRRRQFEREAVVSESDLAQYYHDHQEEFRYDARYRARRIFLQAPREPDEREKVRQRLVALRQEIEEGADFAAAATQHSNGPEADEGGLIGWVRPGDLVESLEIALTSLEPGQISDIVETEYGLHLLKLEEVESEGVLEYAEARKEIEPLLRQTRGDERYRQWISTLRKRNNVRVLL